MYLALEKLIEKSVRSVLFMVLEPEGGKVEVREHFRCFILNFHHREFFNPSLEKLIDTLKGSFSHRSNFSIFDNGNDTIHLVREDICRNLFK